MISIQTWWIHLSWAAATAIVSIATITPLLIITALLPRRKYPSHRP